MAAQQQDTIVTQNVRVQFISINYLYFAKLLASLCALVFWYKAVTAKYSVTQERKENQSRKKFSWRYKVIEIAFTQGSSYLCNSCISAQNQHWGFSWCRNRVRRQECKTPSLQRMCLLSLDLGVAVSRESRAVCWADGKPQTSRGSICFLEKLQRAELKQCCEVLGQAAQRVISASEKAPRAPCARAGSSGYHWKGNKFLQKSQWAAFGEMHILRETYILSFSLGKWGGHPGWGYSSQRHFFQLACPLRNPLGRKLFGLILDILWNWTSVVARNWKELFNF